MRFPRFWAKGTAEARTDAGRTLTVACWRASDLSRDDALAAAVDAARRVARWIADGRPRGPRYPYGDLPLREEVLREIGPTGAGTAVITRNGYGCHVLNVARVMFVDVDLPRAAPGAGLVRGLRRLFGRSEDASSPPETAAVSRIGGWLAERPEWSMRVYRTRAGLRLMATHALFDPTAASTLEAMHALGCDPLYVRLCRSQRSFRARLTPKPWRCAVRAAPVRFPFETFEAERAFGEWQAEYEGRHRRYATCALAATLGSGEVHPEVREIVAVHDEETRAASGLPLA